MIATMHAPPDEALRDLAALLPDALFVVRERSIVYANERGARMLGAPADSLTAKNLADFLDEGDLRRVVAQEEALREGWDTPQTCRLRFRTEAGVVVIADVRYVLLWGNRLGMIARDVSEQLRAEGLMERLARATTEAPPNGDALALLAACEPIFLELGWGVAFTDVLERTSITRKVIAAPDDPVGEYGRSLLGREVPFSETPILARVAETGRPVYMPNLPTWEHQPLSDAHALSRSMRQARVGWSVWCPIVEGGRVTQLLVVVARDLTEHDSIALQLFAGQLGAAERMASMRRTMVHRERLAAVGEMAATLAHEIRNPLAAMTGALTLLQRGLAGRAAQTGDEDLLGPARIIGEESQRLKRLVADLLAFTRVAPTEPSDVDLVTAIQDAVDAARNDPSLAPPVPPVELAIEPGLLVRADPVLLHSALVNVLANALAHTREHVRVATAVEGRAVTVRVQNDGPPIEDPIRGRVFEPFFTTRAQGTGLGLAIVRRNLAAFDATVELESPPRGASFAIHLRKWER